MIQQKIEQKMSSKLNNSGLMMANSVDGIEDEESSDKESLRVEDRQNMVTTDKSRKKPRAR